MDLTCRLQGKIDMPRLYGSTAGREVCCSLAVWMSFSKKRRSSRRTCAAIGNYILMMGRYQIISLVFKGENCQRRVLSARRVLAAFPAGWMARYTYFLFYCSRARL